MQFSSFSRECEKIQPAVFEFFTLTGGQKERIQQTRCGAAAARLHAKWPFTFGRKTVVKKASSMFMFQTVLFWVMTPFSLIGLEMLMD
jgi:hypothetical protein